MQKPFRKKLDDTIAEFSVFLEREYSSQFKYLTNKEDRHLFFFAKILTQLRHVSEEIKDDEKIVAFPSRGISAPTPL